MFGWVASGAVRRDLVVPRTSDHILAMTPSPKAKTSKARPAKKPKRDRSLSPEQVRMYNELAKMQRRAYEAYQRGREEEADANATRH